jgi:NAD(P)-dependent dehydrogenase (short-subunit alcohol dehydrogenase family)
VNIQIGKGEPEVLKAEQSSAACVGRLKDRIAVVTAAAGGIGGATALRLARDGAKAVVAIDTNPAVKRMQESIEASGSIGLGIELDCTDEKAVVAAFADIVARFGRIDILVNGVGGGGGGRNREFVDSESDMWRRVVDVTLLSTMICTRQVVNGMRERRYGKILNIASSIALVPTPKMVEYASAKAGVIGFTRSLALELAPFGVTVNAVSPGPIKTAATDSLPPDVLARSVNAVPMGHIGVPSDIANAVAFLVSDEASYVTGQNLAVNGGRAFN